MPTPAFPWDNSSELALVRAARLDPDDQRPVARYLREVAQSVREHRASRPDPRQANDD